MQLINNFNGLYDFHTTIKADGRVWFVAGEVAIALGYRDAEKMCRMLDDDEKDTQIVGTLGGDQSVTVISQSGLYHAIFNSRKPEAKLFRRWVTEEVLPSILTVGHYTLNSKSVLRSFEAHERALDRRYKKALTESLRFPNSQRAQANLDAVEKESRALVDLQNNCLQNLLRKAAYAAGNLSAC